jgi:Tfp pilus assembly protein PilF/glycosyltransferase involved in cell wall biosynthesis
MPAERRPAVLVQADLRDVRLYEQIVSRGYRLLGFPSTHAAGVAARGVPIEALDFQEGAEPRAAYHAEQVAAAMLPLVEEALAEPEFLRSLGIGDERVTSRLLQLLPGYVARLLPQAALAVEAFELLAEREDLRLLILRDEGSHPAKSLILAARRRGIPSLHLMHGVPAAFIVARQIHADTVAVYGESTREWYTRFGNPASKVAITGNPVWDGYREAAVLTDPRAVRVSLGLDPDRPVVMVATTLGGNLAATDLLYPDWPWQHVQAMVAALGEVHRRRPVQLVIKVHPGDRDPRSVPLYRQWAKAAGFVPVILTGWADARHLVASDLVVCIDFSNISLEAMLLDRPVVSVRLGDLAPFRYFTPEDGVLVAETPAAIREAIEAALFDPATQADLARRRMHSLYRFTYLNDGLAFDRLLQLVVTLLDPEEGARRLEQGAPAPLLATMSAAQRESVGRQHLQQAQRELEQGRLDTAAYLIERARPFLDAPGGAHFLQGCVALQRGQLDAALEAFQDAVAAEADNPAFYNGLASALHALGRVAEAEAALRRAVALDGDHVDAVVNLAELLLEQGRRAEACPLLERARALAPEDAQVLALWDALRA